ncbi:MAG: DUF1616 domain-containing protein [Chloroflexi bacterium]|nr:MAG: DUF1616 domain-containing protein [Chloroflexota bacterium]
MDTERPAAVMEVPWEAQALLVGLALLVSATGIGGAPLRVAAGLPLVLVVPGHTLVALVWRGHPLGLAERAALAVGISLALAALSGLALEWTPRGLGGAQTTILLGTISLAALAGGAMRDQLGKTAALALPRPGRLVVLLGGAAALLAAAAVAFSVWSAAQDRGPGFTQAWLVPGSAGRLDLGLENDQSGAETYRLVLTAGRQPVREWRAVRLRPGQRWSASAALPAGGAELDVYRSEQPGQVYRSLKVAAP